MEQEIVIKPESPRSQSYSPSQVQIQAWDQVQSQPQTQIQAQAEAQAQDPHPAPSTPALAELHFIAEQTARHARIWEDQKNAPPCPNFNEQWSNVTPKLQELYLQQVEYLASSNVQGDAQTGYETLVKGIYERCFAKMSQLTAEMTSSIPYNNLVAPVGRRPVVPKTEPLDEDELIDVDSYAVNLELEEEDEEQDEVPLEYNIRDVEDPQINILENAMTKGSDMLKKLLTTLEDSEAMFNDIDWKKDIERTQDYARTEKVIIGVVGSTGAGKSSLINAIIDEKNILPTDCMRASTAVATEVSYNHGPSKFRAEVEFITRADWKNELEILFAELHDHSDEVRRGDQLTNSDAAVALDKIKAVYPALTPEDILDASIDELLGDVKISALLDTTLKFEDDDSKAFATKLKSYIHSKGKRGRPKKVPAKQDPAKQEDGGTSGLDATEQEVGHWPLVRVVRIYTKAKALETGATLVDLPGICDSNAARVAVAEDYMKRCSAHWIAAPINRAVDDKVARDLLGKNHKRQMQMDSAFSDISFICTKTDDIAPAEVSQALGLDLPAVEEQRPCARQSQTLNREISRLTSDLQGLNIELDRLEPEIEALEERLTGDEFSFVASDLSPNNKKRRLRSSGLSQSSGQQLLNDFHRLREERKTLQNQRRSINQQLEKKQKNHRQLSDAEKNQQYANLRTCIEARNNFSKQEIKCDFAQGIAQMDQDDREDGEDDNATAVTQDYDEAKKNLTVFCVSTRAYQGLRGRSGRQAKVRGFSQLEETEIPRLQRHCIALTEWARENCARRFLVYLNQLFQSVLLWSSVTAPTTTITARKRLEIEANFNRTFEKLTSDMAEMQREFKFCLAELLKENVIDGLGRASQCGSLEFPRIVSEWNAAVKDGGLHWQTYKATCRRRGIFRNTDWNQDLAGPMLDKITPGWKRAFELLLPRKFDDFTKCVQKRLDRFHSDAIASAKKSITARTKTMLDAIVKANRESVEQHLKSPHKHLKSAQKDSSRIISDVIALHLSETYADCAAQCGRCLQLRSRGATGQGTLARIRSIMERQANDNGNVVFHRSTQSMEGSLTDMLEQNDAEIAEIIQNILAWTSRDYRASIIEPQLRMFSKEQVGIKQEVSKMIRNTESEIQL
ncbi:hypothetical protein BO71DRAFT_319135, partial [Aspergillus ellipticus CBS 707.79]